MASQTVGGGSIKRNATTASVARKTFQNTENLFNEELVDWAFEDLSIPSSKIIGGVLPALHATTHSDGGSDPITVENLATSELDPTYALKPDGAGGLVFGSSGGTAAIDYNPSYNYSLESTNASVNDNGAIAIGSGAYGNGDRAISIGYTSQVYTDESVAVGRDHYLSGAGTRQFSFGARNTIYGANSISLGYRNYIGASDAISIGRLADVMTGANDGIAIGRSSLVDTNALNSISIGHEAKAYVYESIAIGYYAYVYSGSQNSIVIGSPSTVVFEDNPDTILIGANTQTNNTAGNSGQSVAIGSSIQDVRARAVHIGHNNIAGGADAVSIGYNARASASYSFAVGNSAIANETREHALGNNISGAGASTFRLGVSSTEHFTFSSWSIAAGSLAVTHSLPVQVNGNTYNLLLNQ